MLQTSKNKTSYLKIIKNLVKKLTLYTFDFRWIQFDVVITKHTFLKNLVNLHCLVFLINHKTVYMICDSVTKETFCTRCHWTKFFERFLSKTYYFFLLRLATKLLLIIQSNHEQWQIHEIFLIQKYIKLLIFRNFV